MKCSQGTKCPVRYARIQTESSPINPRTRNENRSKGYPRPLPDNRNSILGTRISCSDFRVGKQSDSTCTVGCSHPMRDEKDILGTTVGTGPGGRKIDEPIGAVYDHEIRRAAVNDTCRSDLHVNHRGEQGNRQENCQVGARIFKQ